MTEYIYTFKVRPNMNSFSSEVVRLFTMLDQHIEMIFNSKEFDEFRKTVHRQGFTLTEITRVRYQVPEPVQ